MRICVVIPLFNKAPHIARAIKSVLSQTVLPDEVIVVDDGSTDNGQQIVNQYAAQGVRLIQQANQGVSAARNTGLMHANYEYVAFLDADDEWYPNHIEQLTQLIMRYPDAALFSTAHQIRRDGQFFKPRSIFKNGWLGKVDDFFAAYSVSLSLVNSSTACVRKNALQAVGCFPVGVRRGEDIIVWVKLALRYSVAHVAVVTAVFNQEAVNRSDQSRECEPPGSLIFMQQLLGNRLMVKTGYKSLGLLFDRISIMTSAGYSAKGDFHAARSIAFLAAKAGRYKATAIIMLISILPQLILRLARRWRHRLA